MPTTFRGGEVDWSHSLDEPLQGLQVHLVLSAEAVENLSPGLAHLRVPDVVR
jgi:hypothetical protein